MKQIAKLLTGHNSLLKASELRTDANEELGFSLCALLVLWLVYLHVDPKSRQFRPPNHWPINV